VTDTSTPARRAYDSPVRRARAEATRASIVAAGAALVRASTIHDWRAVTIRAVAARAEVNERTVYRHFTNEQALRDAVMQHLEARAGIDLAGMRLDDVADVAARIARVVAGARPARRRTADPTLHDASRRQHDALLHAVVPETAAWSDADRHLAAALLDVLWSVGTYEHLAVDWELDRDEAIRGTAWVIGLVTDAIRANRSASPLAPPRVPSG
jgi:AcrR family transcriptional regulator